MVVKYDHCKHVNRSIMNVSMLVDAARRMSDQGLIDNVSNLQRSKIFTHCGMADGTMAATQANHDFFKELAPEVCLFLFLRCS